MWRAPAARGHEPSLGGGVHRRGRDTSVVYDEMGTALRERGGSSGMRVMFDGAFYDVPWCANSPTGVVASPLQSTPVDVASRDELIGLWTGDCVVWDRVDVARHLVVVCCAGRKDRYHEWKLAVCRRTVDRCRPGEAQGTGAGPFVWYVRARFKGTDDGTILIPLGLDTYMRAYSSMRCSFCDPEYTVAMTYTARPGNVPVDPTTCGWALSKVYVATAVRPSQVLWVLPWIRGRVRLWMARANERMYAPGGCAYNSLLLGETAQCMKAMCVS